MNCQTIEDIQKCILEYIKANKIKANQFINCKGYNQENLKEKRHITKQELDAVSSTIPICIQHYTGHCGVMNTPALQALNINEKTISPVGGKINYMTGFLEENAYTSYVQKIPMKSLRWIKRGLIQKHRKNNASYGITTIQDGMIVDELKDIYQMLVDTDDFFLDVVGYIGFDAVQFKEVHLKIIKNNIIIILK